MHEEARRAARRFGPLLLASGAGLGLAAEGDLRTLGLCLAALGGILLGVALLSQPGVTPGTAAVPEAEPLARWTLAAGPWQAFLEGRIAQIGSDSAKALAVLAALAALVAGLTGLLAGRLELALTIFASALAVGAFVAWTGSRILRRRFERLRTAPPEVVLAPGLARLGDEMVRWHERAPFFPGGYELGDVRLATGAPAELVLELQWRSAGLLRRWPRPRVHLPVPRDGEEEARALARTPQRLRRAASPDARGHAAIAGRSRDPGPAS